MTLTKSNALLFVSIILLVGFIDYQSWLLEQLHLLNIVSMQVIFTIEALLCGVLAIVLYKRVRSYLANLSFDENNLSDREREVLDHILLGKTNRDIEQTLFIEKSTLKSHINRIYKKLDVSSRDELIRRYSA